MPEILIYLVVCAIAFTTGVAGERALGVSGWFRVAWRRLLNLDKVDPVAELRADMREMMATLIKLNQAAAARQTTPPTTP